MPRWRRVVHLLLDPAGHRQIIDEHPPTRILVLTTFGLDEYVFGTLRAGASGFLMKDAEPDHLIASIELAASGESLIAPSTTRRLISEHARTSVETQPRLPTPTADPTRTRRLPATRPRTLKREIAASSISPKPPSRARARCRCRGWKDGLARRASLAGSPHHPARSPARLPDGPRAPRRRRR
jgi:hypothetical protein